MVRPSRQGVARDIIMHAANEAAPMPIPSGYTLPPFQDLLKHIPYNVDTKAWIRDTKKLLRQLVENEELVINNNRYYLNSEPTVNFTETLINGLKTLVNDINTYSDPKLDYGRALLLNVLLEIKSHNIEQLKDHITTEQTRINNHRKVLKELTVLRKLANASFTNDEIRLAHHFVDDTL